MKKIILLFAGLAFFTFKNQAQTVTDIDGNVYQTVTIGNQVWMTENLKTTRYSNGDTIPNITNQTTWNNYSVGAYCDYNNDTNYSNIYGRLYNWYVVNDIRNIAPAGWHVPSKAEWNILFKYLDNTVDTTFTGFTGTDIGGKLKETGTNHWNNPNTGATNSSGFTALPSGNRYPSTQSFSNIGLNGSCGWSTTMSNATEAWNPFVTYNNSQVCLGSGNKKDGLSIRCVKDTTTNINEINSSEILQIYPNPAINIVHINNTEYQPVKIQIYNIIGDCILQKVLNNSSNEIDINSLSKGIYIIKLSGANWTINRKLIKE